MLRDYYDPGQGVIVGQVYPPNLDTHHNKDIVYATLVNVTPWNIVMLDDTGNVRGYAPLYSLVKMHLNPRPQYMQLLVETIGTYNPQFVPHLYFGFDADTYPTEFNALPQA